jgi:hypothetical protein
MKKIILFLILAGTFYNLDAMMQGGELKKMDRSDYMQFLNACSDGDLDAVKYWVEEKGADVNNDRFGGSASKWAISDNQLDILKYLVNQGAKIDQFALSKAVMFKNGIPMMQYLIGQNLNIDKKQGETTPLLDALNLGLLENAKFLIENRANVNAKDNRGNTALHYVCRLELKGDITQKRVAEMMYYLVANGADLSIKNKVGHTAYYYLDRPNYHFGDHPKKTRNFDKKLIRRVFGGEFEKDMLLSSPGEDSTLSELPQDVLGIIRQEHAQFLGNPSQQLMKAEKEAEQEELQQ